jgi:serine protease SohB
MNELLGNYLIFLLETLTWLVAIVIILQQIAALKKTTKSGSTTIKKYNQSHYDSLNTLTKTVFTKGEQKRWKKQQKAIKQQEKDSTRKRLFVVDFTGDIRASQAEALREEITTILALARRSDKILIRLESPGGCVHDYGFAASQLTRLREHNLSVTVAVDKMAASGGYLMACVADTIIAAPFAVIGSIGVILQLPNLHQYFADRHIQFEQLTAGEDKRNLTIFGKNSQADRDKAQAQLDNIHQLFMNFVKKYRDVDTSIIATGKTWHAIDAIAHQLVDRIETSDAYINKHLANYDIFIVKKSLQKPSLWQKITNTASGLLYGHNPI